MSLRDAGVIAQMDGHRTSLGINDHNAVGRIWPGNLGVSCHLW